MKVKAIFRIIICTILLIVLSSILCTGLILVRYIQGGPTGETSTQVMEVDSWGLSNLEIEWAAGTITIMRGPKLGTIIIKETKSVDNHCSLSKYIDKNTLEIIYGEPGLDSASYSGKELVIIVPSNWSCDQLEINGAALKIDIDGVYVNDFELNGAAHQLTFKGRLGDLDAEGAGMKLDLYPSTGPSHVTVEGMGCILNVNLPDVRGFDVTLEGLGVSFESEANYNKNRNHYTYGNENCKIDVSGLGCKVSVDPS